MNKETMDRHKEQQFQHALGSRISPIALLSTGLLLYSSFYSTYITMKRGKVYQMLTNSKEFKSISDLKMFCLSSNATKGNYVSITGKAIGKEYLKTRLATEDGKPMDSILYLYTKQNVFEIWNPANKIFSRKTEDTERDFRTVPFSLQDDTGSVSVNIESNQTATSIPLKKVYSNIEESPSDTTMQGDFLKTLGFTQNLGMQEEEHILQPNTEMTVFGRAFYDEESRKLVIASFEGKPFSFFPGLSREQIIAFSKKSLSSGINAEYGEQLFDGHCCITTSSHSSLNQHTPNKHSYQHNNNQNEQRNNG
eukprot:TRINITY_DN6092_c0_g1_i1.p1 TRINITY_DN6092_c0_g1~~TRINITY_DN6092_c0_g1_i1.p1  ORF type:complete len:308 (+),score=72.03 TRINITY_DN6092_c0_g1_i1:155-1078(+)